MFYRLNNGKPLTAIELTRVKAKSFEKIKELSRHPIFTEALSDSQINKYTNEDIVIKALVMLNCAKPSLENKFIRPFIIETEITDEMAAAVDKALTKIKDTHAKLIECNSMGSNKAAKKLYTRTHLISLIPLALECYEKQVDLSGFVNEFYGSSKGTSVSTSYNSNSSSGSNSAWAVEVRNTELKRFYNIFTQKVQKTEL